MARKKLEVVQDFDRVDKAAGDVAEGLGAEIQSCQQAIDYCITRACDATLDDYDADRGGMFESAGKLMLASAALASALARLRGEFHHRITVTRAEPPNGRDGNLPASDKTTEDRGKRATYPRLAEGGVGSKIEKQPGFAPLRRFATPPPQAGEETKDASSFLPRLRGRCPAKLHGSEAGRRRRR